MTLDDLKDLRRQLNDAIALIEQDQMRHTGFHSNQTYVGDFQIIRVRGSATSIQRCAYCNAPLGHRAYQVETGNWVATGKFPTHDFCGPECGRKWLNAMNLPVPSKELKNSS